MKEQKLKTIREAIQMQKLTGNIDTEVLSRHIYNALEAINTEPKPASTSKIGAV